jgi:hypothetical protein
LKKAIGDPEGLAELMVFYGEQAAGFCSDILSDDEGYYNALVCMFEQALKTVNALSVERRDELLTRLDSVRVISRNIGYGVEDDYGFPHVADRARAKAIEVEVTCSDPAQHRNRVETRSADIKGLRLPTWQEVVSREYEPWERDHIVIDTTSRSVAESVRDLRKRLPEQSRNSLFAFFLLA